MQQKLSLDRTIEITLIITYIGVVFSFMRSVLLDRYHFDFGMSLNEMGGFLSLSNPILRFK